MPKTFEVDKEHLGSLLLRCRAERKLSLEQVAKALRLSQTAVSQIERGVTKNPNRSSRLRIVQFLNKHGYFPKTEAAA